ncbi:MAG: FG-GAP-like repeat-containing protein, partial [Bacteroidales bacterium]|nr:FG-GAP-like repeat-containing protein [Bacteroidales bacterium]
MTISTTQSGNINHDGVVKESIILNPGFSYTATGSNQFIAAPDPFKICEISSGNTTIPYSNSHQYTHSTTLPVGAIAGAAGVSPSGAATYEIPIFVSPGTGGMQPSLSIVYNSQSGNGILGQGWQFSGLSSISLSPNLTYNDGYFEAIKFNYNGTEMLRYKECYSLDGNRLINENGNSYTGTLFRTETETFQKIEKITTGGERFVVTDKAGNKSYYGSSDNSRIKFNNSQILSWLIDKIEDVNGNYMTYEYYEFFGEKLLKKISYTGNSAANIPVYNFVEFYYVERSDKSKSFINGVEFNQKVLLDEIKIKNGNLVVKSYKFKYFEETELENGNGTLNKIGTKLAEIIEKGDNGTALNSTVIEWGISKKGEYDSQNLQTASYFITQYVNQAITEQNSISYYYDSKDLIATYYSGDFNGDGLMDFCYVFNFSIYRWYNSEKNYKDYSFSETYINNGNGGFLPYSQEFSPVNHYKVFAGDFDYDEKTELILVNQNNTETYRMDWNNTTHWWDGTKIVNAKTSLFNTCYYSGKVIGNGKIQQIYFSKSKINNSCYYNEFIEIKNGNGTSEYSITNTVDYNCLDRTYQFNPIPTDFDGDGVMDFINVIDGINNLYGIFEYNSNLSNSIQKIYEIPNTILLVNYQNKFHTGDFNGDGKTDLIVQDRDDAYKWRVYFSDGKQFVYSNKTLMTYNGKDISICDINGDGKDDVVLQPSDNQIVVYLSKGDGSFYSEIIPISYNSNYANNYNFGFGDFNNDGINDIIYGVNEPHIIYMLKNDQSKLVKTITDGMKVKSEFEYSPLNRISGTQKANIQDNTYPLFGPLPVVSTLKQSTGLSGTNNETTSTTYNYKRGRFHIGGKGFMGFEEINSSNTDANITTKTTNTFDFTYNLIKKTVVETKSMTPSTNISKQENEVYIQKMSATKTNYIAVMPKYSKSWDYLLHIDNYTQSTINYAGESSVVNTSFLGNTDNVISNHSNIYTETTTYSNYVNKGSWCVSKPQTILSQTTRDGSTAGSQTTISYDNYGRVTKSISNAYPTPATVANNPLTDSCTYDKFGNVRTSLSIGRFNETTTLQTRKTSYEYSARGQFPIKVSDTTGLITEYQYESKFGNKTWEKDFLGNINSYEYDGFGNLKKIISPTSTTTITRAWESPVANDFAFSVETGTTGANISKKWYDILGREVKYGSRLYNTYTYTQKFYNKDGTLEHEYLPQFAEVIVTDNISEKQYTYDAYKRLQSVSALGLTTNINYNSIYNYINTVTPDGAEKMESFNKIGETIFVDIVHENNVDDVEYYYNAFGKPRIIVAGNVPTTMNYDSYGNQSELIDLNSG